MLDTVTVAGQFYDTSSTDKGARAAKGTLGRMKETGTLVERKTRVR